MKFNIKQVGRKKVRDGSLIRLLNSPDIMASGFSTIFLTCDFKELCDRLKILLQEKEARNNSKLIDEDIVAKINKALEYKCISKKQHQQILIDCKHSDKNTYNFMNTHS